jgi:hypothetical protein
MRRRNRAAAGDRMKPSFERRHATMVDIQPIFTESLSSSQTWEIDADGWELRPSFSSLLGFRDDTHAICLFVGTWTRG